MVSVTRYATDNPTYKGPLLDYNITGKSGLQWKSASHMPHDDWWREDLKQYEKQKEREAKYGAIDQKYGVNTPASTGITSDNTSANPDYSYSDGASNFTPQDYWSLAKDLSQSRLNDSLTLMDASSGYRMKEADQDTTNTDFLNRQSTEYQKDAYSSKVTDDMRRDNQQYGFQTALDQLKYDQESKIQQAGFTQDQTMFNMQAEAERRSKEGNRRAASNLYNTSGKSPFWGGY